MKEYGIYKNDILIAKGTRKELALELGLKPNTITKYSSMSYKEIIKNQKKHGKDSLIAKEIKNTKNLLIIKEGKKSELQEGRTITYLSQQIQIARQYLSSILTGRLPLYETTAKKIIIGCSKQSIKLKEKIEKEGIDNTVKYFFEKVD